MREGKEEKGKQGGLIRMYGVREEYAVVEKVGRGSYGTVFKVRGVRDGRHYAIKKLQNNDAKLQQEGFPITALREITLLKQIDHPNIIRLKEIILSRPNKRNLHRGSTFLVFEYMDHDFAGLFKMKRRFELPEIKCIFRQLLDGVAYLHARKILHRDIKSANILLNDDGQVKLADFGLGRKVRQENVFTYKVVTLWYRAPELLWGSKHYTDKVDVWSLGCVVVEFFTGEVLFRKDSQSAQMERIYEICGDFEANDLKISEEAAKSYQYLADMRPKKAYKKELSNYLKKMCPSISQITIEFIEGLLHLNPNKRLSCEQALRHPFFNEKPLACSSRQIAKQEYECHEMFKDRSIKIERPHKKEDKKGGFKEERNYREQRRERSASSQSKKRQFSHSSSPSKQKSRREESRRSKESRSRSREKELRRRSRSKEDNSHRFSYDRKREQVYKREASYRRDDRKGRQDYKMQKDKRPQEKDYRDKKQKRYKDDLTQRRKDERYERIPQRNEDRRDHKDERRDYKQQRRDYKDQRRDYKDQKREYKDQKRDYKDQRRDNKDQRNEHKVERRENKDDRRDYKDERRDNKEERRDNKEERRDNKEERRDNKEERRDNKEERRDNKEERRDNKEERRDNRDNKDERREKDERRTQRRNDGKEYRREGSKQRRHQRKYQGRGYEEKERRQSYQGKFQGKERERRGGERKDKFVFVRERGRRKSVSSSSSPSSRSSRNYKRQREQREHRHKHSYDRKPYYKKHSSSSPERPYH